MDPIFDEAFYDNGREAWEYFNSDCTQDCDDTDCMVGQYCVISNCTITCPDQAPYRECHQTFMNDNYDWTDYNCTDSGPMSTEEMCPSVCEFHDCSEDGDDVCWKEICDDGCGAYNCSLWMQDE